MLLPGATGLNGSGQPTTLGVMGGGQLGRMFVQAAQSMGYFTVVLDPDVISPAGLVSHYHIQTDYLDEQGLTQLLQRCAAVTTEFENVPAPALVTLGAARPTAPSADAVAIAQDRIKEKAHLARSGVPVAPYAVIETAAQLAAVPDALLPGILKTARLGYDGKGQVRCRNRAELVSAWDTLKNVPCVLEQMLPLAAECSVIVARGWDGAMVHFAPQRNLHREGILAVTEAFEGNMSPVLADQAVAAARTIAEELNYVGVLCVEFFVLQEGSSECASLGGLVVNEMAPRPHNSGHYTLDACDVSQFELQVRTLAGLPLTQPRQHSAAVMLNLLGDLWVDGATPCWDQVLALPGVHLHLYGKLKASKGRKMGHLTVTAATPEQARSTALAAASVLGIAPF
ncbi:5-(carboxyamino)imidazole ribonucleotide synthase [Rhodoferax sp.]|uniref:5-(carboxyamino)imidazole ribonucleotide synthase n=1 Tax=Rhodoferax sp. TaxID=50421 RepID=UPI0027302546|nr:5-(carboxyamino)imidazole ribonucleotide synthase [Rhodoferax sp.]MDP1528744.1 5-(carboxyamino)imidazole ribonucleotide synthase [Rhodoferax sp.]MDP1943771.1 5-(carboxyamino)imidazole ribonucleotide synthase [Rhodoferax sp.]MDZ4208145.1 5-(carboxyamino)imidazole ribonucleotide synthase [Rhodoferax sp.]